MKVVEIFNSIEGEGKRAGLPCTFIRLFGCNLNCVYCDSRYACDTDSSYFIMSLEEILGRVEELGCKNVTITGGEPLIHSGAHELIHKLVIRGYWVNVETNGTMNPSYRTHTDLVFYTVDYKTLASGMSDKMNPDVFESLTSNDVLKFVVGSEEDLNQALEVVETFKPVSQIYVSPVFGQIEPKKIVEYIQWHRLWDWKVQLQLHKIIWDPDMKGV